MTLSTQRTIRIGAGVVGVLAIGVAGLGAYAWMHRQNPAARSATAAAGAGTLVTITGRGCEPMALQVEAGRVTFQIANRSDRALEWEILDGVMVVDERENIAPGMTQRLSTKLEPGEYAITCGLLGNPRGRLTVIPSSTAPRGGQQPDLVALVGPMAEYKVFVTVGAMDLADTTDTLAEAVRTGDRAAALAALAEAHAAYTRIRPAAKMLFADLDAALDSNAADFAAGAADPAFTGFRRLAADLAAGHDMTALAATADRLNTDVHTLRDRLADATIPPGRMVAGAFLLLGAPGPVASSDPAMAAATIDGAEKVADLLRPLTRRADLAASNRLDATFAAARQELAAAPGQPRPALEALAKELATLRDTLGLDG